MNKSPSSLEIKAGVKMFNKYGDLNIYESLTDGDVTKYEEVEKISVNLALAKLAIEQDKKKYKESYQKVLQQDHDRKQKQRKK